MIINFRKVLSIGRVSRQVPPPLVPLGLSGASTGHLPEGEMYKIQQSGYLARHL